MSSEYRKPRKAEKFRSIHSRRMRTSVQTSSAQMKGRICNAYVYLQSQARRQGRDSPSTRSSSRVVQSILWREAY